MSVMTVLEQAQGGRLLTTVAASLDIDEAQTRKAMRKLCPAIAATLQSKAKADDELFQSLLDLIADNAEASPLATPDGLTSAEAIADGNAILSDVYGSRNAAMVALREADPSLPERELSKLAPISATAVVAALAEANRPMALAGGALPAAGRSAGEGFIGALISAIVAGIVSALTKKLAGSAKRRTPARYSRTRSRRKTAPTRNRRTSTASVEDVFRDILGNLGK
jgi:hypothetical protein